MDSVGVIYCDISGLKEVNDNQGHEAGDRLIRHCYDLICQGVKDCKVYRAGGDEFVAVCADCGKEEFQNKVYQLRQKIKEDQCHMAVGYAWSDQKPLELEKLIAQADQVMYQDKREYYRINRHRPGVERRHVDVQHFLEENTEQTPFQRFLNNSGGDMESLFQSVSQNNNSSYFYLGDMQKDLYYISDNMRQDFGFESNLVPGLLQRWSQRIGTPEVRDLFWQDISSMLREKRTVHDLSYRVQDAKGNNQWVRCYGILKWNKDKTEPLFFSGRITHQDTDFVVDPITGLPREQVSFQQMKELKRTEKKPLSSVSASMV